METKYSKEKFDGYTHRFIVKLRTEADSHDMHLYSNSGKLQELEDFINEKKTVKVLSFCIIHRASKEQDELTAKFIDETLPMF